MGPRYRQFWMKLGPTFLNKHVYTTYVADSYRVYPRLVAIVSIKINLTSVVQDRVTCSILGDAQPIWPLAELDSLGMLGRGNEHYQV